MRNREQNAAYMVEWGKKNADKRREYRQKAKARREADPTLMAKYKEQRKLAARRQRAARVDLRLKDALRSRVRVALYQYKRGSRKGGSAIKDLGCTLQELMKHLEKQFSAGMTWGNYGEWEIDHIKPLSLFDLTDPDQFKEAANYRNLQPLWKIDNQAKGASYQPPA
jgi:hypothetical protein